MTPRVPTSRLVRSGESTAELTGIPLEQLIPAPETTMTRRLLATARETSERALLAGKSVGLVEDERCSKGRWAIGMAFTCRSVIVGSVK